MDYKRIWRKTYRTMCQTLIPLIPINIFVLDVNWLAIAGTVLSAGIVCFLSGIADEDNKDVSELMTDPEDDEVIEH